MLRNLLRCRFSSPRSRLCCAVLTTSTLSRKPACWSTRGSCTVDYKGKRAELSKNENKILAILLEHAGEVVSRDAMMNRLWETDCFVDENTLSVNIARLRKTLASISITDLIKTKKGIGYMIP